MKNILLIILFAAVIGGGVYIYTNSSEEEQVVDTTDELEEEAVVVVEEEEEEQDMQEEEESTADLDTDMLADSAYCAELKSKVTGSENYVIMTGVAGGTHLVSGATIEGCVYAPNGSYAGWAPFEGQVGSYELVASDGTSLAVGPLSVPAQNWMETAMANEPLKYQTEIAFDAGSYTAGELILKNENASGEEANNKTVTISVTF